MRGAPAAFSAGGVPLSFNAAMTCSGVLSGASSNINPASAATCGAACEVPEQTPKGDVVPPSVLMMSTPGAATCPPVLEKPARLPSRPAASTTMMLRTGSPLVQA
jgi:hypothetical protein